MTNEMSTTIEMTEDMTSGRSRRGLRGRLVRLGAGGVVALGLCLLAGRSEAGLQMSNGLTAQNGMKVHNGISGHNGMKVHNGISGHNGMKVHNGLSGKGRAPARIWLENGIDPRVALSGSVKR